MRICFRTRWFPHTERTEGRAWSTTLALGNRMKHGSGQKCWSPFPVTLPLFAWTQLNQLHFPGKALGAKNDRWKLRYFHFPNTGGIRFPLYPHFITYLQFQKALSKLRKMRRPRDRMAFWRLKMRPIPWKINAPCAWSMNRNIAPPPRKAHAKVPGWIKLNAYEKHCCDIAISLLRPSWLSHLSSLSFTTMQWLPFSQSTLPHRLRCVCDVLVSHIATWGKEITYWFFFLWNGVLGWFLEPGQ